MGVDRTRISRELGVAIAWMGSRVESRTSLPSVSAVRRKSGAATSLFVVFSQGKRLLGLYETAVIAKPLLRHVGV
jgi:hypothetical protein